jgi:hypothetical protein
VKKPAAKKTERRQVGAQVKEFERRNLGKDFRCSIAWNMIRCPRGSI